jgi:RNA polymerase sigma factor (sigma-70 family)
LLVEERDAPFLEVEELRSLLVEGREKGVLSFEQIAACLEEVEVTKEQVVELHTHLIDNGIEIVAQDGKPAVSEVGKVEAAAEAKAQAQAPKKPTIDLTVEPSLDSLRLYLRSIGQVELLTAGEEVSLAKRIERGDMSAKQHMVEKLNKVVHVERQLVQEFGREPEAEEIALELGWTGREVKDIRRIAQLPMSLEKPIGEEEDSELGDFVEDEAIASPFDTASENLRRDNVGSALNALPQREREVIEMRYGLQGHQARTLEEVGRAFGVTRERIRQIENTTLKKLETLPEAQRLRDAS